MRLRDLEEILMLRAYGDFETKVFGNLLREKETSSRVDRQKSQLLDSPVVQQYLGTTIAETPDVSEDDFS